MAVPHPPPERRRRGVQPPAHRRRRRTTATAAAATSWRAFVRRGLGPGAAQGDRVNFMCADWNRPIHREEGDRIAMSSSCI
jgi:hypothetical protein